MQVNKGFQVTGGTTNIGAAAVGDGAHAHAENVHFGQADPVELLARVRALLPDHGAELPAETEAVVEEVAAELAESHPNPGRLQRLLSTLSGLTSSVEPVATAVSDLSTAVTALTS